MASTLPASKSGLYADPREDWLSLRKEEILDPGRPIVDPHHHLWDRGGQRYLIDEITSDIASGHNVIATVYVEARSMYRARGPEAPAEERTSVVVLLALLGIGQDVVRLGDLLEPLLGLRVTLVGVGVVLAR